MAEELLDKDKEIVVYCGSLDCTASTHAEEKLIKLGYKNVYEYAGGLKDWKEANFLVIGNI